MGKPIAAAQLWARAMELHPLISGNTEGAPTNASRRAIFAASLGNALEWYDFTVYALFAAYIAKAVFPGRDPTVELAKSFLVFGLGFLVRPLGAIVLGVYGDRAGRKAVLTLTITLMVAGTAMIAITPPYAAIGLGAPLMLLAARVLQGFSAGGEIGGATALLSEHAPATKRGRSTSWVQATMAMSNILGAVVALAVTSSLNPAQMQAFGWRIPFIAGLMIAPVGLWLRRTLEETPAFAHDVLEVEEEKREHPLGALLRRFPLHMLRGVLLSIPWTVSSYSLIIYMPVYLQSTFHYTGPQVFAASLIGNLLLAATCVAGGALSDRIGRRAVLLIASALLVVGVYPALWLLARVHAEGTVIFVQCYFCVAVGLFVGVSPSALAEVFPTRVRATGVAFSYNFAVTVFSGFAPAIMTWLSGRGGVFAPAWYVGFAVVLGLGGVLTLKPRSALAQ